MSIIKYRISLDMHSSVSQASLAAKQGDTNRQFGITLRSGGQPYKIERGAFAVFSTTLPDGKVIEDNCIIVNDEITYDFTQNLTSQVGVLNIEIRLYDANSKPITSPTFILVVSPRAAKAEDITSSNSFAALDTLYNETNELKNTVEEKLVNGEFNGVGIESIEQTKYALEDRAPNVMTVVLSNGETRKFTVHNGNKGNPGRKGDDGLDGISVTDIKYNESTDDGGINFLSLERTFGDGTVKETVVPIRNGKTGRAAGFGEITAEAKTINIDSQPTVSIKTSGENDAKNFHFDFGIPSDKQSFANAIQNTATGSIVSLPDVSPLEHTLSVKARSQNQFKPSIISTWQCNASIGENDLITLASTAESGVAYAKVGRVMLEKGKTYICRAIEADNVGSLLFWTPNTTTTIWNATTQTYTPTENITLDLVVYMKEIGGGMESSFYIQLEEGTTAPTKHTPFIPIGSVRKEYTIDDSAKEYISIADIDKCIAKSRAEGRTYANGIENFEIRFSSEGDGFYWVGEWIGNEAELLDQWGIKMLQMPEQDGDSYVFNLFYKDGTNIKAVVAGKNFAQVNSVVAPYDKAVTIFEGEISGDFVLSCKNNVTEFTNPTASLFSWTFKDGTVVYSQRADSFKSVNISGVLTKVELYTYSYPKVGSIDNIQLELGTNQTEYEPYKESTSYPINADGTVEGVTSIYPTTTITSDTEGVVFDVGYNVDTKKYIDNKFAELAALIVNS